MRRRAVKHGSSVTPAVAARGIGINLQNVQDYSPDMIFADAMKTHRPGRTGWSGGFPGDGANSLDSDGWPTTDCGILVFSGAGSPSVTVGVAGAYSLSFTGQAVISGNFTISAQSYNSGTNTTTATATMASDGVDGTLIFTSTKRFATDSVGTGLTNIKLMRPGYTTSDTFTTLIKALVAKFRCIRYMDVTATNFNQQAAWADRMLPTYATQQRYQSTSGYGYQGIGIAWEYVIALANATNTDAWINIPARATDAYVTSLATLIRDGAGGYAGLNSGLALYIEYGNEMWNGSFSDGLGNGQYEINYAAAQAEVLAGGSNLNYDGETNPYYLAWRRVARRIKEISDIFRGVFGDSAMQTRIRPVYAWQQNQGTGTPFAALNYLDGYWNNGRGSYVGTPHPVSYYLYGGGGSAYYNPDNSSDSLTTDNIWTSSTFDVPTWKPIIQPDAGWCKAFGLQYLAYEGGPGMDNFGHSESIKASAWSDSRMTTLLTDHQTAWEQTGGSLLMYFDSSSRDQNNWNAWSFTHDIRDLTTAKMVGVNNMNAGTVASLTFGSSVPGTISVSSPPIYNTFDTSISNFGPGDLFGCVFRVATPATLSFAIVTTHSGTMETFVDGASQGVNTLSGSTTVTKSLSLTAGLHAITFRCKTGNAGITSITVS